VAYALLSHPTAVSFFFFDAQTGTYQGAWNPAEMAFYAGIPTLVLAGVALWSRPRDPLARFFAAAALVSLLLALGDATPLHGLLHSLPVVRGRRAPARYVLLVDASLAVLAAWGSTRAHARGPCLGVRETWRRPPSSPSLPRRRCCGEAGWRGAQARRTGPGRPSPGRQGLIPAGWP
jgi:hypothetical protein